MAVTIPTDLFIPEVATEYSRQAFVQSLEAYGLMGSAGSGAPIEMMNDPVFNVEGQYIQRPVFKRMGSSLVTRRDLTSTSAVTPLELLGDNEIGVKVHRKIGPVDITVDAARLSRATPEEISAELGKQFGEELALNAQETFLNALNGIADGMTSTAHTSTVWAAAIRTNLSPDVINGGLNKMGDKREAFRRGARMILRSESVQDLFVDSMGRSYDAVGGQSLNNGTLANSLGIPPVTVDSAALTVTDAGFDKYITLLVGPGALQVWWTLPMTIYPMFQVIDTEQVINRWRADADFAIGTHGAKYDTANGGVNPTDGTLATGSNWDPVYSNHREVPIVKIVHNYSGN
jgi:hypothetical protein